MERDELGSLTWTDVDRPVVVVPVGACEQHGPHLPIATDTVIARALADRLASRRESYVVAPALTITASGEHQGFPGTLSIGTDVMADVIVEVARSADWASGVVFVNGHGGNHEAMRRANAVFERERRRVLTWWPRIAGADLHAGRTETSLMLALAPDLVDRDQAASGPVPDIDDLRRSGVRALSDNGVLGDPTGADAEEGRRLLDELVEQLVDATVRWELE